MIQKFQSLDAEEIRSYLPPHLRSMTIEVHQCLDSTNDRAKELMGNTHDLPALVAAEGQTAGRGRNGRDFYSPEGKGLYMSLLIPIEEHDGDKLLTVTAMAAVAVYRGILKVAGIVTGIKWVNDLYLGDKKVCGILTEAVINTAGNGIAGIVVGIGINVSKQIFPEELRHIAASLEKDEVDRSSLTAAITEELITIFESDDTAYMETYRQRSIVLGRQVQYTKAGIEYIGWACGIDDAGGLIVRDDTGREDVLASGEISLYLADEMPWYGG